MRSSGAAMIRLTGGTWRGQLIRAPAGLRTRPTGAKVREALFNILQTEVPGARFADVCCGGGTVGLEALSRGADSVTFVESHRRSVDLLRRNLTALGASPGAWSICGQRAEVWAKQAAEDFDILFCDPPYQSKTLENLLPLIAERSLVAPGGRLVVEVAAPRDLSASAPAGFGEAQVRRHGDTALWFWTREAS